MKTKKYIGLSFLDAVNKAKGELGENISILESKKVGSENSLPGGKQLIQISVVCDTENETDQLDPTQQNAQEVLNQYSEHIEKKKEAASPETKKPEEYHFSSQEADFLNEEVKKLNKYIKKFYLPKYPEEFIAIYEKMRKIGIENELAKELIHKAYKKLASDNRIARRTIVKEIRRSILPLLNPYHIYPDNSNRPKPIALIGPAGSGKTRTIMKLATHPDFFGTAKRKIISTGNFGVGTKSTLQKFSQLTDIAVKFLKSPKNLNRFIREEQQEDILFLDTPSLNVAEAKSDDNLYKRLNQVDGLTTFLVIDATRDIQDAEYIYQKYSPFNINGLIITKLDETPRIGKIVSLISRIELPLLAICEGQSIPDHIRKDFKEVIWGKIEHGIKGAY